MRTFSLLAALGAVGAVALATPTVASAQEYCPADAKVSWARVQLFNAANCGGGSMIVHRDDTNGDRGNFAAFRNYDGKAYDVDDSRSSVAIDANTCVRLFDLPGYQGEESNLLCAGAGTVYYGLYKFNDRASSMRVCRRDKQHHCNRDGGSAPAPAPGPQPAPPAPAPPGPAPAPGAGPNLTAPIEALRADSVRSCSGGAKPGARAFRDWIAGQAPEGRFLGIYNCRNVRGGSSLSLHAGGRAVDWGLLASRAGEKAKGDRIVFMLLAPDAQGNQWALARRMGIQEIIWNRRIWTAARASSGLRSYGGSNPHTDHVHVGLNTLGACRQTSFWNFAGGC